MQSQQMHNKKVHPSSPTADPSNPSNPSDPSNPGNPTDPADPNPLSLLHLRHFTESQVLTLFDRVKQLKHSPPAPHWRGESLALLFFEPSTRTRLSFETAAIRVGLGPLVFDGGNGTSLEKGESIEDSILNVAAMNPKLIVVRCGDSVPLLEISKRLSVPLINAGWGVQGHPSQALLDLFTIQEHFQQLRGLKVVFVGDVKHSRVVRSHLELLPKMGIEIGICGPEEFHLSSEPLPKIQKWTSLEPALKWCDVVIALRFQFERHGSQLSLSRDEYRSHFGIRSENIHWLHSNALLMHPGPIHHGLELETEILQDPRCKVLCQVSNGVHLREALLRERIEQQERILP